MTGPPRSLLLLFAYGAGLAIGLSHFLDPAVVAIAAGIGAAYLRSGTVCLLNCALALGCVVGAIERTHDARSCSAQLDQGDVAIRVQLAEPGSAGVIRAQPLDRRCHGAIRIRWPQRSGLDAGSIVTVSGRWVARRSVLGRAEGLLLVRGVGAPSVATRRWSDLLHDAVGERSRQLFGSRAPLVDALVTGRRGELDEELKTAFVAAGLVHLLSISGFHIGLIAGWVLLLLRLFRTPRHMAELTAAFLALGYVVFLGWPAPAARAGWLLLLIAMSRWRQRNPAPIPLLAVTCLGVLVLDPWAVADLGGWLSATALAGAVLLSRWSDRALGESRWWRTLAASVGATLGTAPLTALAFGQVALAGIALNFIAIPLAAAAVPAVIVALLLASIAPAMAAAFAAAGGGLLATIEQLALRAGSAAVGQWIGEPGAIASIPWIVLIVAVVFATHGRATVREAGRRAAWVATAAFWVHLAVRIEFVDGAQGQLALHFLDVGQGDAALIRTPANRWIAVDAGPAAPASGAGGRVIIPFLRRHRVRRLELFVLSHAHRDHAGGAAWMVDQIPIGVALDPGQPFDDASYLAWLDAVARRGVRWRVAAAGDAWEIDGVQFRILHPPRRWTRRGDDLNEDSIVLEIRYRDFAALLTGDAGFVAESLLTGVVSGIDVLKVGHHGSRGASGEMFLARASPRLAIVSVGRNGYGHPAPAALQRLARSGAMTMRTDHEGTVSVVTDGSMITVRGKRTSAELNASPASRTRR